RRGFAQRCPNVGFWGKAEILCSTRAPPVLTQLHADPYSSRPRNRLDLSIAFEAGRAEVLAWEQAGSEPSAGITVQQTDTPFCRGQLAMVRTSARHRMGGRLMTHLIDKNLVERANTVLLLGILARPARKHSGGCFARIYANLGMLRVK